MNVKSIDTIEQVRYFECDSMKVVHHLNYFVWLENARFKLVEEAKINFKELEQLGFKFPVIEIKGKYFKSARFGDSVLIKTELEYPDTTKLVFRYSIYNMQNNELLFKGFSIHVVVADDDTILIDFDPETREKLDSFFAV